MLQNEGDQLDVIRQLMQIITDKDQSDQLPPQLKSQAHWWVKIKIQEQIQTLPHNDPMKQQLQDQLDKLNFVSDEYALEPIMESSFENLATESRRKYSGPHNHSPNNTIKKNTHFAANHIKTTESEMDYFTNKSTTKHSKSSTKSQLNRSAVKLNDISSFSIETQMTSTKAEDDIRHYQNQRDYYQNHVNQMKQKLVNDQKLNQELQCNIKVLCNHNDLLNKSSKQMEKDFIEKKKTINDLKIDIKQLHENIEVNRKKTIIHNDSFRKEQDFINSFNQITQQINQEIKLQNKEKQCLRNQHLLNEKILLSSTQRLQYMIQTKDHIMESVEVQLNKFNLEDNLK